MADDQEARLARWHDRLQNLTVSPLTRDYPEPTHTESEKRPIEAFQSLALSPDAQNALKQLQVTDGSKPHTYFSICLAVLVILVARLTGDEDISIGTNGEGGRAFVLRTTFDPKESFLNLLAKIEKIFEEWGSDAVSLETLLSYLKVSTKSEKTPVLYRFALYHAPNAPSLEYLSSRYTTTDLLIYLSERPFTPPPKDGDPPNLEFRSYFNQRIFASSRITMIMSQLSQLIENAALNPDEAIGKIDMITTQQRQLLPDPTCDLDWSNFRGGIHDIFALNARAHPDKLCVVETATGSSPRRNFTYKQINEASNILGHHLVQSGIQRGEVVMVYAHRGVDLVVAVMGVLKAGATFSVIDPAYPPDRQNIYLDVARPRALVIIEKASVEAGKLSDKVRSFIKQHLQLRTEVPSLALRDDGSLIGGTRGDEDVLAPQVPLKDTLPGVVVGPDSTPTLSFTSGSEGRPKGVRGRHYSLAYYFDWMSKRFNLSDEDKFTMLSGIAHDPIQRDIFTPLFLGAQLLVPSRDDIQNEKLAEWMRQHEATVTHLTPAMGQILVGGATAEFPSLHHAFFVGDILIKRDCRLLQNLAPNVYIVNMYGTTETQRAVSYFEIPSFSSKEGYLDRMKDVIPAGTGMKNVQLLVVNRFDPSRLCAVGEVGEIYVRAAGLAEGYLGSPELSEKKFVKNWFTDPQRWIDGYNKQIASNQEPWKEFYLGPRDRLYRSGDLGRYTPTGDVECSGRADDQVKIRGFRIELGEIDTHLSQHPIVRENVTLVRRNKDEEPTLVSYIVPEMSKWASWLKERGVQDDQSQEGMVGMLRRFLPLRSDAREHLRGKLPSYAISSVIIPLKRMPLNPNGKVDKPALPFPDTSELSAAAPRRRSSHVSALSETEMAVAKLWAKLIPNTTVRMIRLDDSFFDLGGHSIIAQQMMFEVKRTWRGLDISMNAIFRNPTLKGYASEIDRARDPEIFDGNSDDQVNGATNGELHEKEGNYAEDADALINELPAKFPSVSSLDFSLPLTVFLTGATGFLGAYLIRDLLSRKNPSLSVIALVRAKSVDEALVRVNRTCEAYGVFSQSWGSRLQAVAGNLGDERFGLGWEDWEALGENVDVVIHNGAQVHWVYPYRNLKPANVNGTIDALKLCAKGKAKQLAFVSSTSVLDTEGFVQKSEKMVFAGGKGIRENDDLSASRKGLSNGYGQSKWVGEYLVREAGRRGLRGAIIRPGYVTGDSKTGVTNTDDFLIRMVKGCIQLSSRPNINNTVNMVPVDHVARIVVASAFYPPVSPLGVAQVTSHPRLRFNQFLGTLETYGYNVPQVDYIPWSSSLESYVNGANGDKDSQHALMPLYHFVIADLPTSTKAPELDDSNAAAALRADAEWSGQDVSQGSGVTEDLMGVYISYLKSIGFLPAPPEQGHKALPSIKISERQKKALLNVGGRGSLV